MKKIVIHRPGSYDKLTLEESKTSSPGENELLISVRFVGVNYADCMVRMGLYESAKKYVGWPITPGFEVSGVVEKIGSCVSGWEVGDEVMAVTRFDGYSSHVVVPAHQVFSVPDGFSLAEAAGFPTVFLTAYYAMFALANPRKNLRMLVHSAAGGVGGALLQLAKIAEAFCVGVVGRSHKVESAQKLGADHVIDKSKEPLWPTAEAHSPDGYHVIFDANGVATIGESYNHLASPGKLVIYGFHTMIPKKGGRPNWFKLAWDYLRTKRFDPLAMTGENRSVLAFNLSYLFSEREILEDAMGDLLRWASEGKLQPPPIQIYPFEEVARAHEDIESAQTVGKLILEVEHS